MAAAAVMVPKAASNARRYRLCLTVRPLLRSQGTNAAIIQNSRRDIDGIPRSC
jgi:hypothetical protein